MCQVPSQNTVCFLRMVPHVVLWAVSRYVKDSIFPSFPAIEDYAYVTTSSYTYCSSLSGHEHRLGLQCVLNEKTMSIPSFPQFLTAMYRKVRCVERPYHIPNRF